MTRNGDVVAMDATIYPMTSKLKDARANTIEVLPLTMISLMTTIPSNSPLVILIPIAIYVPGWLQLIHLE